MGCSSLLSSIAVASRGVLIVPGEIAFTLILNSPNSIAAFLQKFITPAFAAE